MTTTVKIEAHCSDDFVVEVVTHGTGSETATVQTLNDGETFESSVYDQKIITVRERLRGRYDRRAGEGDEPMADEIEQGYCGTCRHYRPDPNAPNFGSCIAPYPICWGWKPRGDHDRVGYHEWRADQCEAYMEAADD